MAKTRPKRWNLRKHKPTQPSISSYGGRRIPKLGSKREHRTAQSPHELSHRTGRAASRTRHGIPKEEDCSTKENIHRVSSSQKLSAGTSCGTQLSALKPHGSSVDCAVPSLFALTSFTIALVGIQKFRRSSKFDAGWHRSLIDIDSVRV
eukprot:gnl/TRDRNA2_/TRDRNA2_163960_c0_seq1.p1 gnl/TRDRNA2_/TRDRNA2_163960_c0~~gnl/TRDRNA2_/TRDRNA2_163960_c0_seq1.p1  ORF type:complete len:149 (+),score=11.04 gnl/TRDRNA2_/TRDRNA2_163960_c0_seq1:393-839(+)